MKDINYWANNYWRYVNGIKTKIDLEDHIEYKKVYQQDKKTREFISKYDYVK